MEHRHLLPDEIDLLVDGEEGFGVAPLAAHVEQCARCRAEVDHQLDLVSSLERLPHLEPSPLFAYRVMSKVQVFEPWHVTVLDSVRRFVPRSRPALVLAAASAGFVAVTLTLAALWIGTQLGTVALVANLATERLRASVLDFMGATMSALVGETAAAALLGSGPAGVGAALGAFFLTVILAAVVLRALAQRAVAASAHGRRM
ncbi:MAG TPA: hypothetical protein VLE53_05125 [Gemmatimonadaceae bacterium]|nr:hypothetical protein [Gemmatimonadaceae bacterium]